MSLPDRGSNSLYVNISRSQNPLCECMGLLLCGPFSSVVCQRCQPRKPRKNLARASSKTAPRLSSSRQHLPAFTCTEPTAAAALLPAGCRTSGRCTGMPAAKAWGGHRTGAGRQCVRHRLKRRRMAALSFSGSNIMG